MLFNSYPFILAFLPVTFLGFFWLARFKHGLAALWLVVASLIFYGWWNPKFVLLLLASIAVNYGLGRGIAQRANSRPGKRILVFAISANLFLLGAFKYTNFFIDTLNAAADLHLPLLSIVLPLGISFYTFTQIAFLVDSYRGISREYNPIHYVLFVTYFPHLIAGPILHHKQMMPQFESPSIYRPDLESIAGGLTIFTIGLAKKVLLADSFAEFASPVFAAAGHGAHQPAVLAWTGAFAYTMQLYFDFSGYSDMAIGLSRLFGVQLPINFNSPYKARSIIDFWRRWHMTLSQFLKDYLYIPLGGNRYGKPRVYFNLMLTMVLGGLWHGASWTFVLWGTLHGVFLLINHAWRALRQNADVAVGVSGWPAVISTGLTFVAVVVAWVLFRSTTLDAAARMLADMFLLAPPESLSLHPLALLREARQSLFDARNFYDALALSVRFLMLLSAIAALLVWGGPNTQEYIEGRGRLHWRADRKNALLWGMVLAVCLTKMVSVSEFLYFQF